MTEKKPQNVPQDIKKREAVMRHNKMHEKKCRNIGKTTIEDKVCKGKSTFYCRWCRAKRKEECCTNFERS